MTLYALCHDQEDDGEDDGIKTPFLNEVPKKRNKVGMNTDELKE